MPGTVIDIQYADTATAPATGARSISVAPINYEGDWRILEQKPGEVTLTNINASIAMPEKVRIAYSGIPDIFKNSDIEPAEGGWSGSAMRRGVNVLVQVTGSAMNGEGQGPFPYSAHMVLRLPTGGGVDHEGVIKMLSRLLGHLYDTKATDPQTRIESIIRGAIAPSDL